MNALTQLRATRDAIVALLSGLRSSETYWRKAVERDVADAQKYLNETYKQEGIK